MKKWFIIVAVFVVGVVAFDSKFYYPALPVDSVSKKEVLKSLNHSTEDIVKIVEEADYEWFISRMEQGKASEHLKQMVGANGWQFETQEGSGYFFKKAEMELIATTQMWTGDYVLIKIPNHWD